MGRRGQFEPGKSGNPQGRPRGSRDKRTALRGLLEPHSEALVQKAVDLALEGDTTALRLCLERIIPSFRSLDMPVVLGEFSGSLTEQAAQINRAMAAGKIATADASSMLSALASQARIQEFVDMEHRVAALEEKLCQRG